MKEVEIESSWKSILEPEFSKDYFLEISNFLRNEKKEGKVIFPPGKLIFNAFNALPLDKVKVVVLGQDPYHGRGEAHGLSFSVPKGIKIPPSLRNIYKELANDIEGFTIPNHGNLESWLSEGVFLLNAFLTVEENKPKSHEKIGWEQFTDAVIRTISENRDQVVFMLWGNFARKKAELIDSSKHLILESAHPSPLAGNAFQGSKHFSRANEYFISKGLEPVNWLIAN